MTLQEGCNKILVSDCFTLLEKQFHNLSRGLYSHKETQCGGCGGRIVLRASLETQDSGSSSSPSARDASIYCDTFVFNCKHAFHIECLPADEQHKEGTNCSLCSASKKRFWNTLYFKKWEYFLLLFIHCQKVANICICIISAMFLYVSLLCLSLQVFNTRLPWCSFSFHGFLVICVVFQKAHCTLNY